MKKVLSVLLVCLSLLFLLFLGVDAKALEAPSMVPGASIRTTGEHQGLKFSASVTSLEGVTEHGFFIAKGEHSAEDIATAVNSSQTQVGGNKLVKKEVTGSDLTFHVVIYNIPAGSYGQDITALAYVYAGGSYTFASTAQTRNINEIAAEAVNDPGYVANEFINRIVNISTFVLNGGEFTYDYQFTIAKSGNFGENVADGYYVTCGTKANYSKCCNSFWSRMYINKTTTNGLYQVIAVGDAPENYDYVIAVHASCYDTTSRSTITSIIGNFANMNNYYVSFTAPTSRDCNIVVNVDRNIDKLTGNNIYYEQGDTLLTTVKKAYYNFAGWYDNISLTGDAITTQATNSAVTYYAKWTPKNYTLSFDLQGGKVNGETSKDDIVFTYESDAISLPAAGLMTRTDYTFVGWYDNPSGLGEAMTSIPNHSHDDITVYAVWEADVVNELSISSADTTVLTAIDADIIVKGGLDGKYSIDIAKYDGVVFNTAGGNAFATLAAALDYLDANTLTNKKIYVFAGEYSDAANITQSGTIIYGPNYNINGYDSRNTEASITGLVTITGASSVINGLGFTDDGAIKVGANNVTISYVHMRGVNNVTCNGNNRKGCIVDSANITNLTVKNSYINAAGATQDHEHQYMSFTNVSTLTITDNHFTNEATTLSTTTGGMLIYRISGIVNITGNHFTYATSGYVFRLGLTSNTATRINIKDNVFSGRDSYNSATIGILKGSSSLTTEIMHNQFINFATDTYYFESDTGSTIKLMYNYYDNQKNYQVTTKGSAHITNDYNYYAGTISGSDVSGASVQPHPVSSVSSLNDLYDLYLNESNASITYDLNGGVNEVSHITSYREGFDSDALPYPTRAGYAFKGWELVEDSGSYIDHISYLQTGDVEVHAAWEACVELAIDEDYEANLAMLNNNVPDIVVIPGLSNNVYKLGGTSNHILDSIGYTYGTNLFTTISAALTGASAGDVICVFDGTYNETLTISKSNITLIGPNNGVAGNSLSRYDEAEMQGVITLAKGLVGFKISGFAFTGNSRIINTIGDAGTSGSPSTNINGFTFSYNVVTSTLTSGDGFIYFTEAANSYSHDLVFTYNSFSGFSTATAKRGMIHLNNLYNLTVTNNEFKNISSSALYVTDETKGASGKAVLINNNTFNTISEDAIHLNWISYLSGDSGVAVVESNGNTFTNVSGIGVYYGSCNNTDTGYVHVQANNNTFNGTIGTPVKMNRVVAASKFTATGNTFNSVPTSTYYVVNGMTGSSNKSLVATGNTYATTPTDANFSGSVTH